MESGAFDGGYDRTDNSFVHLGLLILNFWPSTRLKSKDYNANMYVSVVGQQ